MGRAGLTVWLVVFLDLLGFGVVIPLLPFYAERHGASAVAVTGLMAIYSLAQFLGAPAWGALSDRVGRRPVLLWSIAATATCLAGFASAESLAMLFLWRGLHGLATANLSVAQASLADVTPPERRAAAMGMIGVAFGLGFTAGPVLGGFVSQWGLTAPLWLAAGLSAVNWLLALATLQETRQPGGPATERSLRPATWVRALSHPRVGACIGLTAGLTAAFALMESTFALFAGQRLGMGPSEVGGLFGLAGLTTIVTQGWAVRRLVDRFGERPLIPIGMALLAAAVAALPFVGANGVPFVFCAMAAGQGLASPSLSGVISRRAGDEQGLVLGVNQSMAALGRVIGPATGGWLFVTAGPESPFVAAAVLLVVTALAAFPALSRTGDSGIGA